jgi:hypothetical protein
MNLLVKRTNARRRVTVLLPRAERMEACFLISPDQIRFSKWRRWDSNPRPPACKFARARRRRTVTKGYGWSGARSGLLRTGADSCGVTALLPRVNSAKAQSRAPSCASAKWVSVADLRRSTSSAGPVRVECGATSNSCGCVLRAGRRRFLPRLSLDADEPLLVLDGLEEGEMEVSVQFQEAA